ncbi:hypothetical protein ACHAWF_012349 [Thalassiosira exigua]
MFDGIVRGVTELKEGGPDDVAYRERVAATVVEKIDPEILSGLAGVLPSLRALVGDVDDVMSSDVALSQHELAYALVKLLKAVLEAGRFLAIVCDDLQFAHKASIDMMVEILVDVGQLDQTSCRLLFIGMYRSDEIDDNHPFVAQKSLLQMSVAVSVTEITLPGLSKEGVVDMLMTGLKLPKRMVAQLAGMVSKKTAGHAFFVVELLNSLVKESIIAYSLEHHCYSWDLDRVDFLPIEDDVATLLVSNLSTLPGKNTHAVAQMLSTFGMQTDESLLQVLDQFQEGTVASVETLVEGGILDRAGGLIMFTHDLIHQTVYNGMSLSNRQSLHLKVGQYLGSRSSSLEPTQASEQHGNEHTFFAGSQQMTSCLGTLACDQINFGGEASLSATEPEKEQFAMWNLIAGDKSQTVCNFAAAAFYYEKGISFLGRDSWNTHWTLSKKLYKGATMAAFALCKLEDVIQYGEVICEELMLLDTLEIEAMIVKSLGLLWRIEEAASRGLETLRQLRFDVPSAKADVVIPDVMAKTENLASKLSVHDMPGLVDRPASLSAQNTVKLLDALLDIAMELPDASIFPWLAYTTVEYSMMHCICPDSVKAFVLLGMLKISVERDYKRGKMFADAGRMIFQKYGSVRKTKRAKVGALASCYQYIDIWTVPLRDIAPKFKRVYDESVEIGLAADGIFSLMGSLTYSLLGGENLAVLSKSSFRMCRLIAHHPQAEHNYLYLPCALCDCVLITELSGKVEDYLSLLDGPSRTFDDILADAKSSHPYMSLKVSVINCLRSFWRGDYVSAEKHAREASENSWRFPTQLLQVLTFFACLVSLRLYKKNGDQNRLAESTVMSESVKEWAKNSPFVFKNRWLLLKAERATLSHIDAEIFAEQYYRASIKESKDHGYIHDMALGYELLGRFLSEISGRQSDAVECFKSAHRCYLQWGAIKVAERLEHEQDLDMSSASPPNIELLSLGSSKHPRPRD